MPPVEPSEPASERYTDSQAVATLSRHRWVSPAGIAAKCDRGAAVSAYAALGGRVDQSTITIMSDGAVLLAPWVQIAPVPTDSGGQG